MAPSAICAYLLSQQKTCLLLQEKTCLVLQEKTCLLLQEKTCLVFQDMKSAKIVKIYEKWSEMGLESTVLDETRGK